MDCELRKLQVADCESISHAFKDQGWNKPVEQYHEYLEEQKSSQRDVIVAFLNGEFGGYVTIKWESPYSFFRENKIPEIMDLNVLKKFQAQGIGTRLISEAERIISEKQSKAGIGVGLISDYGNAQSLYIKRGYVPDKKGISQYGRYLTYNDKIVINDDLVMYLTKDLSDVTIANEKPDFLK